MKRLICTLVGAVALVPFSAGAQMRGGGMVGRGAAPVRSGPGFAPRGPGFVSHGPAFAPRGPAFAPRGPAFAPRGPAFAPRVSPRLVSGRPAGARVFTSSGRGFSRGRSARFSHFRHNRFFFGDCFGSFPCDNGFFFNSGFGFGSPFFNSGFGFGSPFFDSGFGFGSPFLFGGYPYSYYPSDYNAAPQPAAASSDNSGAVELAREVQRLSDQIEDLRYEEGRRESAERRDTPPSHSSLSAQAPASSTTFVLRDGRHIVAQNYAIAGQSLWIVDEHRARKIALVDVDRAATEQVNAANGVDIRFP